MTGQNTRKLDNSWLIATSMNLKTGSEPVNASTPGNAEVPDNAKAKAGAMVMMPVKKSMSDSFCNSLKLISNSKCFTIPPSVNH